MLLTPDTPSQSSEKLSKRQRQAASCESGRLGSSTSGLAARPAINGVREQDRQAGRPPSVVLRKLDRALDEFATYVDNNAGAIVNYGERYRCGERISTGFVESAVNQVISKRFVKKQQMRWTPRGAHLLLQVRTQVLNDELRASFERWYLRFGAQDQASLTA